MGRVLVFVPAFDEGERLRRTLERLAAARRRWPFEADVLVVDDGSTDGAPAAAPSFGFRLVRHESRGGPARVYETLRDAARGHEVIVTMAGNGKDDPEEVPRLVAPMGTPGADLVQGSRYVEGGKCVGHPWIRRWSTRLLHPWLFRRATGRALADTTNGFRAYRTSALLSPRLDPRPAGWTGYSMEVFLLAEAVRAGLRVVEVPVTKTYPVTGPYTKVPRVTGWWQMIRPLLGGRP
ncbi:MAG: glycosyltransferase family 2 protein [Planctomycetales bacterium]|nr:glycosyltransferase family 2 protein [Planctomycetales bacterium]